MARHGEKWEFALQWKGQSATIKKYGLCGKLRLLRTEPAEDAKREILEQKPSGAGWRDFFKKVLRREELCHWNI